MTSDHKPITEAELKEMEREYGLERGHLPAMTRLIAEVRRLRAILTGCHGHDADCEYVTGIIGLPGANSVFCQCRRTEEKPCDWPGCDGIETIGCPHPHRHFKDGYWLDDGSEM